MTTQADQVSSRPFPDAPPAFAIRLILGLRGLLLNLANRLVPPELIIFEHGAGLVGTILLGAAARLQIADLIGDGALTAGELAAKTGTHPDALHRTLRALATKGVFELLPDGRFRNNRFSEPLKSGRLARSQEWMRYFASASNVAAWADFDRVLATGESAFPRVFGKSIWAYFEEHPDEREMFAQAMMGLTVNDAPTIAKLYPFAEVKRLCDVGGGRGTLLSELLIRHPHLQGVLCDAPGVLDSAKDLLQRRGVAARVELVPGSFFEQVPSGCDAYLLKNILHDWDDPTSITLLGVVRRAMGEASRLLLVETLTETNSAAGFGPLADVQMMVACDNGRERSRADFAKLLGASGFRLARVFESPTVSVLEGLPV